MYLMIWLWNLNQQIAVNRYVASLECRKPPHGEVVLDAQNGPELRCHDGGLIP